MRSLSRTILSGLIAVNFCFIGRMALAEDAIAPASESSVLEALAPVSETPATVSAPVSVQTKVHTKVYRPEANPDSLSKHSLNEILFKITRAKVNLEHFPDELGGHRSAAVEYLQKALDELKQAK